ncbi:nuclear transport factor 2 family protein [Haloactinomyces albus]|uniref:Ketosteroid isomerase-like protein n=1 Tax=Haloactinomyces albus TaxID=1352928 RepID=A0AAE4CSA4_9ACTN|nr:nuclear transport factor 2 family protein [Haloactinomyces albus]MDR7304483.1 ketosteroid isomerase-like protein [Haloactinomyces albus]
MATDTQTSRTVAEKFVERLGRQDPDGIQELFSEEIDWHVPGSDALPWTGRRTRREEVAPYFTTMWPHFAHGRSKVVLERVIVDGGDVMLLADFTHTVAASGKEFTTPAAMHLVVEDNRIVRMHLYEDTLTVDEAFNAG